MIIAAITPSAVPTTSGAQAPQRAGSLEAFERALAQGVQAANTELHQADQTVEAMVEGRGANLHEAMIALERADITARLTVKVGEKLVQAYQQVSQMQV